MFNSGAVFARSAEKNVELMLGNTSVKLTIHDFGQSKFLFLNLHQNEITSKKAAFDVASKCGGKILYITHGDGEERNISFSVEENSYLIDPNRIFSKDGIIKNLLELNGQSSWPAIAAVESFASDLLSHIDHGAILVALHNNKNSGEYSVKSYTSMPLIMDVIKIYNVIPDCVEDSCPGGGDFLYTDSVDMFDHFKRSCAIFSSVLQDNFNVCDDGSLSVYAGKHSIEYVNSEAEVGHLAEQVKMLNCVLSYSDRQ